jgi:hypothetical protein
MKYSIVFTYKEDIEQKIEHRLKDRITLNSK